MTKYLDLTDEKQKEVKRKLIINTPYYLSRYEDMFKWADTFLIEKNPDINEKELEIINNKLPEEDTELMP